jgi:anti-anti-sigma regulatory factor
MSASARTPARCGRMTIRLEGVLDAASATKTLDRIAEMPCEDVLVDFVHVTDLPDTVLAYFVGALSRIGRSNAALRGLGHHRERLVIHLGMGRYLESPRPEP